MLVLDHRLTTLLLYSYVGSMTSFISVALHFQDLIGIKVGLLEAIGTTQK